MAHDDIADNAVSTPLISTSVAPTVDDETRPASLPDGTAFERNCSVGRTVSIIGDGWTFMILRECYFRVHRFQDFQQILGVPKGTLASRLRSLIDQQLLTKVKYSDTPSRFEYRLTERGLDLYKVMLALMRFGDKWLTGEPQQPVRLHHVTCNHESHPFVGCPHCRQEIHAREVSYRDGPGAGWQEVSNAPRPRKSADPLLLERRRPSSVARALRVIGDRWGFMVAREAFFKVRRFDKIQSRLGIAPNILTNRLNHFVENDIFRKVQYQTNPDRYEYRLTDKGRDLFGPFMAMLAWGDRWLSNGQPPLLLTHSTCGHDFVPQVMCDHCRNEIRASDMRYKMAYVNPIGENRSPALEAE
ncbi:MAG: helix-turn-helix transcriptional regulator [Sulfuritalea sp.]|nr:helix-turn-helix transcriptional regulator [Sulfuritalea sp.]